MASAPAAACKPSLKESDDTEMNAPAAPSKQSRLPPPPPLGCRKVSPCNIMCGQEGTNKAWCGMHVGDGTCCRKCLGLVCARCYGHLFNGKRSDSGQPTVEKWVYPAKT